MARSPCSSASRAESLLESARYSAEATLSPASTGIGRPLIIVVSKKPDTSADTPDCAEPPPPKRSAAVGATLNSVARAAATAHAAARQAAKAAAAARIDADKAEAAAKAGDKAGAASASERATRDALSAYTAHAKAQAKAREARIVAAGANDPVLTNLIQTAETEADNAAKSATDAGADADRARHAVPKTSAQG